jgi:hypothetical protein
VFLPHLRTRACITLYRRRTPRSRRSSNISLDKFAIIAKRELWVGEVETLVYSTGPSDVVVAAEMEAAWRLAW